MALYSIVGRLGLYGCTRPARGMQSFTCAGIIVILFARQKSSVFHDLHLKISGKQSLCRLDTEMYGGGEVGLTLVRSEITLDIGSARITPLSAFCQI